MAIYKQVYKNTGNNTELIKVSGDATVWSGCFRPRMTIRDLLEKGACNTLSISNNSGQDAEIRFGFNVENGNPIKVLKANSTVNINPDDGFSFWGFDIVNRDAGTDIAIGSIDYMMRRVDVIPEGRL